MYTVHGRTKKKKSKQKKSKKRSLLLLIAPIVLIVLLCAGWFGYLEYEKHHIADRDTKIAQAMHVHPEPYLLATTQRVSLLKKSVSKTQVVSLTSCTSTSSSVDGKSFAYLISYDQKSSSSGGCSLAAVVRKYGRPNSSVLVAGTYAHPTEQLLLYDAGKLKSNPRPISRVPATILPIALSDIHSPQECVGQTTVNVVAHEDDDLLFINPEVMNDITSGGCVRTIFITAGDAGNQDYYWLSRQRGSESAYSFMTNQPGNLWVERIVHVQPSAYITIATQPTDNRVSLIFMHLPDGNLTGSGFKATKYESLTKLLYHNISVMHSVDSQSQYTSSELENTLAQIVSLYQPTTIRTQSAQKSLPGDPYLDHSDHVSVGAYMQRVYKDVYGNRTSVKMVPYHGYPIRQKSVDLSTRDIALKQQIFLQYAKYDNAVCQTSDACTNAPTYGSYLTRNYTADY